MSQPPFPPPSEPYYHPQYPYAQQPYAGYNPYASAQPQSTWCRVTGVIEIVAGGLAVLLAFCVFAMSAMIGSGAIPQEQLSQIQGTSDLQGKLPAILIGMGVLILLLGIVYVILGIFVWRRSMGVVITSMVLNGVLLLLNLIVLAGSAAIMGASQGVCFYFATSTVLSVVMIFLVLALRDLRRGGPSALSHQQQWQQYDQAYYQSAGMQQPAPPIASPADASGTPPVPPVPAPPVAGPASPTAPERPTTDPPPPSPSV